MQGFPAGLLGFRPFFFFSLFSALFTFFQLHGFATCLAKAVVPTVSSLGPTRLRWCRRGFDQHSTFWVQLTGYLHSIPCAFKVGETSVSKHSSILFFPPFFSSFFSASILFFSSQKFLFFFSPPHFSSSFLLFFFSLYVFLFLVFAFSLLFSKLRTKRYPQIAA